MLRQFWKQREEQWLVFYELGDFGSGETESMFSYCFGKVPLTYSDRGVILKSQCPLKPCHVIAYQYREYVYRLWAHRQQCEKNTVSIANRHHRAFNMNEFRSGKAQQPLPSPLLENEARIDSFVNQCRSLCTRILELFALGLEISPPEGGRDWFSPYHDSSRGPSGSVFRLLYYPSLPESEKLEKDQTDIRAGAHSDYGTITLLFQRPGQPGLEILTSPKSEKEEIWSPVPVNPTNEPEVPILVNVGDLLNYWTNGLLKSAVHRVIFPEDGKGEDRYSIAYFCHPIDEARLEAVPSTLVQGLKDGVGTGGGKVITAKEHLEERLKATYASKLREGDT
jgi:isopenicillin N synthase-like dioxygenase